MTAVKPLVTAGTNGRTRQLDSSTDYLVLGKLNIGPGVVVNAATTIVIPNSSHILLNNPGGGAINVDFINGANDGDVIILRLAPGSGNVRVRKGNGNVFGGSNRLFNDPTDILTLLSNGTAWGEVAWQG